MSDIPSPFELVAREAGRCLVWMPEYQYRFLIDLKDPDATLRKLWALQEALDIESTKDRYFGARS